MGVVLIVAVVLVEREAAVALARIDGYGYRFARAAEVLHLAVFGQNRACLYVDGIFVELELALDGLSATQECARRELVPVAARRQPHLLRGDAVVHRACDGVDKHVVAEHILVAVGVSLLALGVVVVHRAAERQCVVVGASRHTIYIRCELVALAYYVVQDVALAVGEHPRLFIESGVLRRVGAQDRAERAELHPAYVHLGVDRVGTHVSAHVVAPVAVEHVGCRRIEIRLEVERFPANYGIARETYLIAVVAQSAPTVVEHRARVAVALHVGECCIVDPPGVAEVGELLVVAPLLPVEPPEVDTVLLHRVQHLLVPALHEVLVGCCPLYILLRGRVNAHPLRHHRVAVLVGLDAVGRVQVERGLQVLLLSPLQETLWRGEETAVPGVARPATA